MSGARWRWAPGIWAIVLAGLNGAVLEAQCSMCRTLLATPEGQRAAGALRSGIWILLAAPFVAFAVVAVAAIRSQRRFSAARDPHPPRAH